MLCFDLYTVADMIFELSYYVLLILTTIKSYCRRNAHVKILTNLNEIDGFFAPKLNWKINYYRLKRQIRMAFIKWTFFTSLQI